ncbi:MAG: DUF2169 domain-containing protein [Deltaproteobacteria bacterium]|nr:DUF2169 domain-containing protein [Deltaproteobacteria bacterium]
METRNHTPFPMLEFESRGHGGEVFHVLVLKATFALQTGPRLRPDPSQRPLALADEYYDAANGSSLRFECDISPFKPTTDIHVVGHARAPGSMPQTSWSIQARVGEISKSLCVTGPRSWRRSNGWGRWTLSHPIACVVVPLRYELAYGGVRGQGSSAQVCVENPVGCGFGGDERGGEIRAPQIEDPNDPICEYGRAHLPQGMGPIARSWQPRLTKAGTFDQRWLDARWPDIPDDFDFAHYNSAHPDLIAPEYLGGDEEFLLSGFHPEGPISAALPGYTVFALVRLTNGVMTPAPMNLDTVVFDVDAWVACLTWRCRVPARLGVRVVEIRLNAPGDGR